MAARDPSSGIRSDTSAITHGRNSASVRASDLLTRTPFAQGTVDTKAALSYPPHWGLLELTGKMYLAPMTDQAEALERRIIELRTAVRQAVTAGAD